MISSEGQATLNTAGDDAATLAALGWSEFFAQQVAQQELSLTPPVRIVAIQRSGLHVIGAGIDETLPPRADVAVGDWLLYDPLQPRRNRVLHRKSLISRRAPGSGREQQLIAANIDTAFIVTSCNEDFNLARLERYAAMIMTAAIEPVIVLTKADLATEVASWIAAARGVVAGIEAVALDARGDQAAQALAPWLRAGATLAMLGSSGVGKSTLGNALLGRQLIATQGIREDDAKGRHTTTHRQLHLLAGGCVLLDTPGMRELQLSDAAAGVAETFTDIHNLAANCRFADCQHGGEPGCAVQQAVAAQQLDPARVQRWRKLLAESAFNAASLAERRHKERAFGKMVRRVSKEIAAQRKDE